MSRSCQSAHVLERATWRARGSRAPARRRARTRPGSACAAWRSSPSALRRTAPAPRGPRCAPGAGSRWRARPAWTRMTASAVDELRVTVALDHLGRGLGGPQAEPRADELLDPWVDARVRADDAADRADARRSRARAAAARGRDPARTPTPRACARSEVGSAWMPCERPIITVSRCCERSRFTTPSSASSSASSMSARRAQLQREPGVEHVARTSCPKWIQRPSGPIEAATTSTNAATSWRVTRLALEHRLDRERGALAACARASSGGIVPSSAQASTAEELDLEPVREPGLVGPDRGHLGQAVARDQSLRPSARSSLNFQSVACTSGSPIAEDLGGQDGRVHRGVDADGGDGHARGHLGRDREGLVAHHLRRRWRSGRRSRGAPSARRRPRRGGPDMPGGADHDLESALERGAGVLVHQVGVPGRGHDPDLVRHAELLQDQARPAA